MHFVSMAIGACGTPVDPKGSSRLLAVLQLFKTKSTAPLNSIGTAVATTRQQRIRPG